MEILVERNYLPKGCLESQFGEEPLVLAALVAILEAHANLEAGLLSLDWVFEVLNAEFAVECDFWHAVASRHQMVVVDELKVKEIVLISRNASDSHRPHLNERLNSAILVHFRLVHSASDASWVAVDASDERLAEHLVGRSVVECLHDDRLATSKAPAQHEHHLA